MSDVTGILNRPRLILQRFTPPRVEDHYSDLGKEKSSVVRTIVRVFCRALPAAILSLSLTHNPLIPPFYPCSLALQIDAHPFKYWYENHYGVTIGLKKGKKVAPTDEEVRKPLMKPSLQSSRRRCMYFHVAQACVPNWCFPVLRCLVACLFLL